MGLRSGDGTIRTRLEVKGTKESESGIKNVTQAFKDLRKGGEGVGSIFERIGPTAAAATAGFFLVREALQAAAGAAQLLVSAFKELGNRGGDVSAVVAAYERLGNSQLIGRLNEVSGNLVRNQELMARSTQVLRTGIVSAQEWTDWIEATTRAAQDMGRDVSASIQSVATALSGGGLEALAQLGVNVMDIRQQLQLTGETMETTEGRLHAVRLAMIQMQSDMGTIDNSAGNLNDAWTSLSVTWENWVDQVAQSFSENAGLVNFFEEINRVLRESLPPADELADLLSELFVDGIAAAKEFTAVAIDVAQVLNEVAQVVMGIMNLTPLGYLIGDDLEAAINRSERLGETLDNLEHGVDSLDPAIDRLQENVGSLGDQAERTIDELLDFDQPMSRNAIAAEELNRTLEDLWSSLTDFVTSSPTHTIVDELNAMGEANRALSSSATQTADDLQEEADAIAALTAAVREADDWVAAAAAGQTERSGNFQGHGRPAGEQTSRGGGGGNEALQRAQQQRLTEHQKELDLLAQLQERDVERMRQIFDGLDREAELFDERNEAWVRYYQEQKDSELELHDLRMRQLREYADAMEQLASKVDGERKRVAGWINSSLDVAQSVLDGVGSSLSQAISYQEEQVANMQAAMEAAGMSNEAITAATKDQVEQIERLKKAEGAYIIAKEVVEAAISIARAVTAFATQDYFGGAMHIVAAGLHGVAAGMAAARLGGGSASVPTAPVQGSVRPTEPENVSTESQGSGGVQITNFYGVHDGMESLGRSYENAVWRRQKSDLGSHARVGPEYGG